MVIACQTRSINKYCPYELSITYTVPSNPREEIYAESATVGHACWLWQFHAISADGRSSLLQETHYSFQPSHNNLSELSFTFIAATCLFIIREEATKLRNENESGLTKHNDACWWFRPVLKLCDIDIVGVQLCLVPNIH